MIATPKGKSGLFLASSLCDGLEDSNLKQVTTLLENKEADPNVILPLHGITPFHLVIGNESEKFAEQVTKLFLRHGGNPNVKSSDGMTPVHVAAAWGRVEILELLLANGGDPLCLDDDGRNPFHYALDGSYYDAIAILAKYCSKNHQDADDESGNVQIKLEKILFNRGDVIAEYVPSEIDLTDDTTCKNDVKNINVSQSGIVTSLQSPETNSYSYEELVKPNTNNITFRRQRTDSAKCVNAISPILPSEELDFNLKDCSLAEEKLLVNQIIRRLSTTLNGAGNKSNNHRDMRCNKKTNICGFLPQPKIFKNKWSMEKKKCPMLLDTSIISKSPNFKIPVKKEIEGTPKKFHRFLCKTKASPLTPKQINMSPPRSTNANIKTANSTPKRKQNQIKSESVDEKVKNHSRKNRFNISQSTPDGDSTSKIVSRRIFPTNIAKRLDSMYDETENKGDLRELNGKVKTTFNELKPPNLLNNVDIKNILGINKTEDSISPINKVNPEQPRLSIESPSTPTKNVQTETLESQKIDLNISFLQSPGSTYPTSASYLSMQNKTEIEEELKILDELSEIYNAKGRTPLASISRLDNDSPTNLYSIGNENLLAEDFEGYDLSPEEESTFERTQSTNTDVYKTPLRSTISSRSTTNESFVSIDEEYAYVDREKDVAFLERRLKFFSRKIEEMNKTKCESSWCDKLSELSIDSNRVSPRSSGGFARALDKGELAVSNASLRHYLQALGDAPGPITKTTHHVYLKRLYKLKRDNPVNLNDNLHTTHNNNDILRISKLPSSLLNTDWSIDLQYYRDLEEEAFREYENPNSNKKYRGGMAKSSFNYLLLDPRTTKDLPRTGRNLAAEERWKIFLGAIFYIGKGKAARPLAHLYDAFDHWTGKKRCNEASEKIQKILDIWREGKGVVCLQVFMNTMQEEALSREAAMIDALGTCYLSNCNRGNYYGILATMSSREKRSLGKYFLYKAMEILMHDGERQQFPRNIE